MGQLKVKSRFPARRLWRIQRLSPKGIQGEAEGSAEGEVPASDLEALAELKVLPEVGPSCPCLFEQEHSIMLNTHPHICKLFLGCGSAQAAC